MAVSTPTYVKLLLCLLVQMSPGGQVAAQQTTAEVLLQQARDQVMIMTNQLMTNASVISQAAEGNASRLLADFYNEVSKGIADAQHNATMIGNNFQLTMSKRAEEVMAKATAIYGRVERSLRDSTTRVEQSVARLVNSTEHEMHRAMHRASAVASSPPTTGTTTAVDMAKNKNPQ